MSPSLADQTPSKRRQRSRWPWLVVAAVSLVFAAVAARWAMQVPVDKSIAAAPANSTAAAPDTHEPSAPFAVGPRGNFVTSQACKRCHEREYQTWHASYHRTMTQFAGPESVVAPIENAILEHGGRTCRFERRDDRYFVTLPKPEWEMARQQLGKDAGPDAKAPLTTREIVILTGSHNMQTFWIRSEDGFRQVPWYWNIADKRWIPAEHSFLEPPGERGIARWNDVCIKCHTSGDVPGLHPTTGFDTRVAELGIACEACHGRGRQHVEYRENRLAGSRDAGSASEPDKDPICNPAQQNHVTASQICAQCHSSARVRDVDAWLTQGASFQPGDDLNHHFHLVKFNKPLAKDQTYIRDDYWADGTCRTAGDEFQGLMESACHVRGELSCLSCHSLHQYADRSDQLKRGMEGNGACLQCHAEYESKLAEHTHHAAGSSGSLCYNCHMPHVTYGLLKGIRSHRIDSPSAAVTAKTGRPNACNLCHLDQTLSWTADRLSQWYNQPTVELSDDQRQIAESVRSLLAGDAAQRVIAAWHLGWPEAHAASGSHWQGAVLAHALDDPYSVIRYVGHRSLQSLPGLEQFEFDYVGPPADRRESVQRALAEWKKSSASLPAVPAVLLDAGGQLRHMEFQRLKQGRDERLITIHE